MAKLELNVETLKELTDAELSAAAGGAATRTCIPGDTQSLMCPSGSTWFTSCESYNNATCS